MSEQQKPSEADVAAADAVDRAHCPGGDGHDYAGGESAGLCRLCNALAFQQHREAEREAIAVELERVAEEYAASNLREHSR
jgi:hypothetical protein